LQAQVKTRPESGL